METNGTKTRYTVIDTYGEGNVKLVKVQSRGNYVSYKLEKTYFYKGERKSTGLLKRSDLDEALYVLREFLEGAED